MSFLQGILQVPPKAYNFIYTSRSCLGNKTSEPSINFRGAEGRLPSQQSCVSGTKSVEEELVRPKVLLFVNIKEIEKNVEKANDKLMH